MDTPNASLSGQNSPKITSLTPLALPQALKKSKEKVNGQEYGGDTGSDIPDPNSWGRSKKNIRHSDDSDHSGASNKSESRSSGSHCCYLSHHSRSSRSKSPANKKRRRSPNTEKSQVVDTFSHNKHKRKYQSPSKSESQSPVHCRSSKKMWRNEEDYYQKESRGHGYYKEMGQDSYISKSDKDRDYYCKCDKDRDYCSKSDMLLKVRYQGTDLTA